MFEALKDVACFVTAFVSFLYGTRIAWGSGKECQFSETPENRKHSLQRSVPAATLLNFFGFLIVFNSVADGFLAKTVFSLTSAIILANMVVSMAMPELKRRPSARKFVLAELKEGSTRQLDKKALNVFLAEGRISRFKRSDGWVIVGKDRLRDMNNRGRCPDIERREAA